MMSSSKELYGWCQKKKNRSLWFNRCLRGFPCGSDGKESACNADDLGSIPPREGNGYPLQYSCLENPMDRGAWQARPWGRKVSVSVAQDIVNNDGLMAGALKARQ